jgi:peroxiredoxin
MPPPASVAKEKKASPCAAADLWHVRLQLPKTTMNTMKKAILSLFLCLSLPLFAAVENGQKAPAFTLQDVDGNTVSLSDFAGKTVVLEWINPGCPFVRKFYDQQHLPAFQKKAAKMGVVWLAINSTKTSHGDYMTSEVSRAWAKKHGFAATWLMDADGTVGKAYDARTTPHMYIINPEGVVVYQGAIDSVRDAKPESIAGATNYVMDALKELAAGKPVSNDRTRPYGCSVKY